MRSNANEYGLLEAWTDTSKHVFSSITTANRAAFAAVGGRPTGEDEGSLDRVDQIKAGEAAPEWHVEVSGQDSDRLEVGDYVEFSKTLSEEDVWQFAAASGDTNPLHLDDEFAEQTRFGGRIVHGTLVGSLIGAALTRLPGLPIYLSQDLEFHNPVQIGDRLTAICEIVKDLGDEQYRLSTHVIDDGNVLIDGEAVVFIDDHPLK